MGVTTRTAAVAVVIAPVRLAAARPCWRWAAWVLSLAWATVSLSATPARAQDAHWRLSFGVSRPVIAPTDSDFPGAGQSVTLGTSDVTFPHLAVARRAGPVELAVGYRKLGVLRYRREDGTLRGNTHSNALEIVARHPVWHLGPLTAHVEAGGELVRTIAVLAAPASGWPYAGGVNTWRALPLVGAGAAWSPSREWAVGVTYAPVLGRLGTSADTGRYHQQVIGFDLEFRR